MTGFHILDPMSSSDLTDLAWDLASDGFVGRESVVRRVVRKARGHGVSPVLTGVLADPQSPEVARLRAFGEVASLLAVANVAPPVTRAA
jgi:hypothetical protein